MYATVSIEPGGKRYACRYAEPEKREALQALETMGGGVTLLRTQDNDNWEGYPEWEWMPGIGWVA